MFLQARHDLYEIAGSEAVIELIDQDFIPTIPARTAGARQREEVGSARHARCRTRLHGGCADFLEAYPAEGLAKAVDALLIQAFESLWRDIPPRNASATG